MDEVTVPFILETPDTNHARAFILHYALWIYYV